MRCSKQIKPINQLKTDVAEIPHELQERREPAVITQNGEANAVLMEAASHEQTHEAPALLKLLALSQHDVDAGRVKPVDKVIARLRAKRFM